jgi:hypothetical protein
MRMPISRNTTLSLLFLVISVTTAPARALEARIVNGTFSFGDPTVGALLSGSEPDQAMLFCSGTLIGCSTFVTAAHCVCELDGAACQSGPGAPNPAEWLVFFQHAGFVPVESIEVPAGYDFPADDVAVVRLATPVSGITPSPLAAQDPATGSGGTIVGFGLSSGSADDYGLKQRGQVTTSACSGDLPDDLVCWDFEGPLGPPGTNSNTCNGDSGGPLFADAGGGPLLAGITSGGSSFDCMPTDESYDTSVAAQRPFIDGEGGADLGSEACGSLSQVGDGATQVVGFTQRIDAGKPQATHTVEVGPGLAELRVALNASEEIGADVDLYVRFGTPPTTTEFDCRAYGSNQWGFCRFPEPAEGTWHILVRRYSGASTYQVTATLFSGEGSPPPPPPVADKQRRPQRRCLNSLAVAGARVAHAQAADAGACLHAFARGRTNRLGRATQTRTAEACLSNDVDGDVARALADTLERDAKRCQARPEQLPDFAYRGGGPVNGAARGQAAALAEDLFGPDLDAVLASKELAPAAAGCQEALMEAAGGVLDAGARLAVRAKRNALRGSGGQAVESAAELELALLDAFARDPHGRLTRARARLQQSLAERCDAIESPLATLFPGVCGAASALGDLADCADAAALCRLCQAQNAMDGLALDCDLFDDGVPDLSCP